MSSTNKTTNLELSQFLGSDSPKWLTDYNADMEKIDAGYQTVKAQADATDLVVGGHTSSISTLQDTTTSQGTAITGLRTDVNANSGSINTINSLIGNGEPTTTDKTLIGAINELHAGLNNGKFRVDETVVMGKVTADGVKSFSQLIAELRTAVLATLRADYNANARFSNVTVFSPVLNFIRDENAPSLYRPTSDFHSAFTDVNLTNGDIVITQLNFGNSTLVHSVAGTYTDISGNVPASGTEITVYGIRYIAD